MYQDVAVGREISLSVNNILTIAVAEINYMKPRFFKAILFSAPFQEIVTNEAVVVNTKKNCKKPLPHKI